MSTTMRGTLAASVTLSPSVGRVLLAVIIAVSLVGGLMVTPSDMGAQAISSAGADLTRLLRAMAAIKLLMAAAAGAAIFWRLGEAITPPRFVAYAVAGAAMAAGPGLIWDMAFVRTGAILLHGGLLVSVLVFWRDPRVGERLGALVASRRSRR